MDAHIVPSGPHGHAGHTYAVGDLHGEVTLLRRLLAAIDPGPHDRLVFLGDYLDRGEDSVATVLAGYARGRAPSVGCPLASVEQTAI